MKRSESRRRRREAGDGRLSRGWKVRAMRSGDSGKSKDPLEGKIKQAALSQWRHLQARSKKRSNVSEEKESLLEIEVDEWRARPGRNRSKTLWRKLLHFKRYALERGRSGIARHPLTEANIG